MSMKLSECQTTKSQPAGKSVFSTAEQKTSTFVRESHLRRALKPAVPSALVTDRQQAALIIIGCSK